MRIALAQYNTKIGDFAAIDAIIDDAVARAREARADLLVFPQLFLIGGPAGDFAARRELLDASDARLLALAQKYADGPSILIGAPERVPVDVGTGVMNTAALLQGGRIDARYRQRCPANFSVKNAARVFDAAPAQPPMTIAGHSLAVSIGNDLWNERTPFGGRATHEDLASDALAAADLLIHLDADPWFFERPRERFDRISALARTHHKWVLHANTVGGHSSLLYDGRALAVAPDGTLAQRGAAFEDALIVVDLDAAPKAAPDAAPALAGEEVEETFAALVMGLRDGVRKSGFHAVTFGLSGGIDSALVAAIAYEALGSENVHGVALPSRYSSDHSLRDAKELADALELPYSVIEIEGVYQAFLTALAPSFEGTEPDTAEENLQARARGTILMGLSNKFNRLVLATSNKSEFAVGYTTLYGDMCGAFSILSDVPKLMVYRLSRYFNARMGFAAIPESTLTKPPSAELRPDQVDEDSLPPYEVLDEIIDRALVRDQSADEIVAAGFKADEVSRVLWLLHINGYKREQAAPGLLVSRRALAIGRDYPTIASFEALALKG